MDRNRQRTAARMFRIGKNKPQTFYISSACYSDNTKQMLQELRECISMSSNKAVKESFWEPADLPSDIVRYSMNDVINGGNKNGSKEM